ncbi:MAG TPA: DUF6166 domain-containing protein [Candidatus Dormibacteraeota bacterium]|nr:DUF6166 domain-containing protein [Candidatus Dormibacteraeota bacterium]
MPTLSTVGKRYQLGRRPEDGRVVATVIPDHGRSYPLRRVVHHSPAGLEYGYGGSGPADLALSILVDLLGEDRAWHHYQAVKWRFIVSLDARSEHTLDGDQVLAFCRQREQHDRPGSWGQAEEEL